MDPDSAFPGTRLRAPIMFAFRLYVKLTIMRIACQLQNTLAYAGPSWYALGMEYNVKRFPRMGERLYTEEYTDSYGHIIAYYDDVSDTEASVTVFDPSTSKSRQYAPRSIMRTRSILIRHLDKLGYKNRIDHGTIDPDDIVLSYR